MHRRGGVTTQEELHLRKRTPGNVCMPLPPNAFSHKHGCFALLVCHSAPQMLPTPERLTYLSTEHGARRLGVTSRNERREERRGAADFVVDSEVRVTDRTCFVTCPVARRGAVNRSMITPRHDATGSRVSPKLGSTANSRNSRRTIEPSAHSIDWTGEVRFPHLTLQPGRKTCSGLPAPAEGFPEDLFRGRFIGQHVKRIPALIQRVNGGRPTRDEPVQVRARIRGPQLSHLANAWASGSTFLTPTTRYMQRT